MSKFSVYFDQCVNVTCARNKVDRTLVFSPNRAHKVCDCRVIIFNIVTQRFPENKARTQELLLRKHPFYYYAERVHSDLMEFNAEYRDDFNFCKDEMVNFARRKLELRKKINEALEYFGNDINSATSFFVDNSKAEIWINGEPVEYKFKANSPNKLNC